MRITNFPLMATFTNHHTILQCTACVTGPDRQSDLCAVEDDEARPYFEEVDFLTFFEEFYEVYETQRNTQSRSKL